MLRAGVVKHPGEWKNSGYGQIENPPDRYALIDLRELTALCGFAHPAAFQTAQREWIEQALGNGGAPRDDRWSESIAVGSLAFVESLKVSSGAKRCIAKLNTFTERMLCAKQAKLTTGISGWKLSR